MKVSAIGLILIGQLLLGVAQLTIPSVAALLSVYFPAFNILEASQLSWGQTGAGLAQRRGYGRA